LHLVRVDREAHDTADSGCNSNFGCIELDALVRWCGLTDFEVCAVFAGDRWTAHTLLWNEIRLEYLFRVQLDAR
jgi:hypothetical protein